jgi:hypothetical protein
VVTRPEGDHALTAGCEVWAHQMGWELRLQIDGQGLLMSSVVRSGAEMIAKVEEWHDTREGLDLICRRSRHARGFFFGPSCLSHSCCSSRCLVFLPEIHPSSTERCGNGVALMPYHCADGWIYEAHLESGDGRMTTAPDPWRPARDVTGIPMRPPDAWQSWARVKRGWPHTDMSDDAPLWIDTDARRAAS